MGPTEEVRDERPAAGVHQPVEGRARQGGGRAQEVEGQTGREEGDPCGAGEEAGRGAGQEEDICIFLEYSSHPSTVTRLSKFYLPSPHTVFLLSILGFESAKLPQKEFLKRYERTLFVSHLLCRNKYLIPE